MFAKTTASMLALLCSFGVANAATITSSPLSAGSQAVSAACSIRNSAAVAVDVGSLIISDVNGANLGAGGGAPNCSGSLKAGESCFSYIILSSSTQLPISCQVTGTVAGVAAMRGHFVLNDSTNTPVATAELR